MGFLGLIGQWGDWTALPTNDIAGTAVLKRKISEACGVPELDFIAIAPEKQPCELQFKGRCNPLSVGRHPEIT